MRKADIVTGAILLGIGLLVGLDCVRLGVGWGMEGPRAGFWPFLMAAIMIVGSVIILVQAVRRKGVSKSSKPFMPREAIKPVLKCAIPATAMVVLTEFIGLYIAAGLFLAVYMRWIGRHRWVTVLILSIGIPAVSYIVFDKFFLIPMPEGSLKGLLGF